MLDTEPSSLSPTGGLGYSRHYAQRIRDLGQTSKDSWIKRLWNHMFGSGSAGNKKVPVVKTEEAASGGRSERSSSDCVSNGNRRSAGESGVCSSDRKSCDFGVSHDRRTDFDDRSLLTDRSSHHGLQFIETNEVKKHHHHVANSEKHETMLSVGQRHTRSTHEMSTKAPMPPQLVNSPYLPPKEKMVYYRPMLTTKPSNRPNSRDGITAAKLRYQRLSKSSTALRSSTSNTAADRPTPEDMRKSTSTSVFTIKRQFKRDSATIQMEKRAKAVADRAMMVCINS